MQNGNISPLEIDIPLLSPIEYTLILSHWMKISILSVICFVIYLWYICRRLPSIITYSILLVCLWKVLMD